MKLLILGGTVFLGRAVGEAAVAAGHDVATFTRGRAGAPVSGARNLIGDRSNLADLQTLATEHWDAVVDVCRMSPQHVELSTQALGGASSHYVYVSSTSVYADRSHPVDEESEVVSPAVDGESADVAQYSNLKVRCEEIVRRNYPNSHCIVRPGLLVGPGDLSDRFTYWVRRAGQPGPILAPGRPQRHVRFTDVRDLATWMVAMAASKVGGLYNVDGPAESSMAMADVISLCQKVAKTHEPVHWIEDHALLAEKLVPYIDLPLWVPEQAEYAAFAEVDSSRALERGMRFRSAEETVRAVAEWARQPRADEPRTDDPRTDEPVAGLSAARERELLQRLVAL